MYMIGKPFIKELLLWPRKYILIAVESRVKKKCLILYCFKRSTEYREKNAYLPGCKILEKFQFDFCCCFRCWFFTCITCAHVSENNFCKLVLSFYHMFLGWKTGRQAWQCIPFPSYPSCLPQKRHFEAAEFPVLFLLVCF